MTFAPLGAYRERMSRLLLPFADQHVEIPSLTAGNIALTVGLKQVALQQAVSIHCFLIRNGGTVTTKLLLSMLTLYRLVV